MNVRPSLADWFPMLAVLMLWGGGPPLYKYLERHGCDPFAMCFYRTLSAAISLTAWVCVKRRAEFAGALRQPLRFVLMGGFFMGGLLAFTAGTFEATATLAMLVTRAIPLVAIGLSALFFLDERCLIRRADFLGGCAVAVAGLVGLCVVREGGGAGAAKTSLLGVALLLICATLWGLYAPIAKAWLRGRDPFVVTTLVFWAASAVAGVAMAFLGNPRWPQEAPLVPVTVMFVSGPILMGVAEGLFFTSVKRIGLAASASVSLLVPFTTALYAWFLLDEVPTLSVAGFGLLLLLGMALIVRARSQLVTEPVPIAPNPQGAAAPALGRARSEPS